MTAKEALEGTILDQDAYDKLVADIKAKMLRGYSRLSVSVVLPCSILDKLVRDGFVIIFNGPVATIDWSNPKAPKDE